MVTIDIGGIEDAPDRTLVSLVVPPGQAADVRLDVYLTRHIANATRSRVQQGIKEGRVTVNGDATKSSYLVQPGDRIDCVLLRPPPMEARPEDIPIEIVFEDDVLIVVDKPAGMVVHPAYGNRTGTLVNALLHHTGSGLSTPDSGRDDDAAKIRPGLVHRLDKDTSGLMVVAKDDDVHAALAAQFANRTIDRLYEAVVWGEVVEGGTVETNLGRDPRDRKRMAVVKPPSGKRAVTSFKPLESLTATTLVQFKLGTGRTHQIRVHAAHLGNPVFGDSTYGGAIVRATGLSKSKRRFFQNLLERHPGQALHARTLGFTHPVTSRRLQFEADHPAEMKSLIEALRRGF